MLSDWMVEKYMGVSGNRGALYFITTYHGRRFYTRIDMKPERIEDRPSYPQDLLMKGPLMDKQMIRFLEAATAPPEPSQTPKKRHGDFFPEDLDIMDE